jgi:hypothetical protein
MGRVVGSRSQPLPTITEMESKDVWRIETKYFTVDVRVCFAKEPCDVALDGSLCEGVVLVFDMTDESSFKHLECWQPFLKEHSVEVGLCAANKSDLAGGAALDASRDMWTNWCLDHELELCECSAKNDVFTGNRDTEGVERVVEALGSHTWSGFTKKALAAATPPAALDPAPPEAGRQRDDQVPATRAFDVGKWDQVVAAESALEAETKARAELGMVRLERTCYDGEIHIDEEVHELVQGAQLSADEVAVISELLEVTQHPELHPDKFFRDPTALTSALPGPNSALHLNLDVVLRGAAQVVRALVQIYKEAPAAGRLLVRSTIWRNMVDAAREGEEGVGGVGGLAAVPVLVPLAMVWSVLESCAAETPGKFFARVSSSKEELGQFLETAMAPAGESLSL